MFERYLRSVDALGEEERDEMRESARRKVAEGVRAAEEAPFPDPEAAARNVYAGAEASPA